MRQVRQAEQHVPLVFVGDGGLTADLLDTLADAAHLGLLLAGVPAVFTADADFFAQPVALGLEMLALGLGGAARGVVGEELVHEGGPFGAAEGEAGFDEVGVFADEADVEHKSAESSAKGRAAKGKFQLRLPPHAHAKKCRASWLTRGGEGMGFARFARAGGYWRTSMMCLSGAASKVDLLAASAKATWRLYVTFFVASAFFLLSGHWVLLAEMMFRR